MPYRYLPHTAEVKFEATGETLAEAFSEAAKALTHVMTDEDVRAERSVPILIRAESKEALFFDYLSELIVLLDTEGLFVSSADLRITHNKDWNLSGKLSGDDAARYARHGDVKAPTYHDMRVEEGTPCLVRVTLDI